MYFTGFDCLGCPAAYAPAQDLLSGAVTVAAVRRGVREGSIDPGESVVCVLTGSGFKDFDRILDLVEIPSQVIAGYEAMAAEAERIG